MANSTHALEANDASPTVRQESHLYDRDDPTTSSTAADTGLYEIRGLGAKRKRAAFRRPGVPRPPRCRAIRSKAIARSARRKTVLGTRYRQEADRAGHPDHDRRHELRRAVGERQGSARPGGDRAGHLDHDGRRRHDARGTPSSKTLVYQCLPSRYGFNPDDLRQGRRDRGRHRPGREAGRRRHAARAEDQPARRRDAHVARRASTSARPAVIRTGPARTIWRSRSTSCARSPTGEIADLREDRRDAGRRTT